MLKIARDCRLEIPKEKENLFLEQINSIVSFVDTIEMNQEPNYLYDGSQLVNIFRKDEIKPSLDRSEFLNSEYFYCKAGD